MARETVSGWFEKHKKAKHATLNWLRGRRDGKNEISLRGWFLTLKKKHRFPFNDYTALLGWLNRNHDDLYASAMVVKPKAKQARAVRRPSESFKRTGDDLRKLSGREDFIVTSAVNNCPVDPDFLAALERWRDEKQGVIAANAIRYKNPTTRRENEADRPDQWWDPALHPYLLEDELRPHPLLSIMTMKAQATAHNPLPARLDGRTKARSAVFGHPQLAMRTVPTPQNELPKILYSSGAVTQKNYSDTLVGDMARFHHSLAAVIVEVRGKRFHTREVVWDGEKFIDLDQAYYADRIEEAPPPAALVMGDIHVGETAENVMEATFGEYGMYPVLMPEKLVLHDLGNGMSVNPHEADKRLTRAAQARRGQTSLQLELDDIASWLGDLPVGPAIHVIPSNHDEFLDRWLERGERGVDAENQALYHELSAEMLRYDEEHGDFPVALELAIRNHTRFDRDDVTFHVRDEAFTVKGISLEMHGDRGSNGVRGSAAGFARLGTRSMTANSHSPVIWQGACVVGTSTNYRLNYNKGPSSWLQCHGLVHANGYRQLVPIIDENWHG